MKDARKRLNKHPFIFERGKHGGWIPVSSGIVPVDDDPVLLTLENGMLTLGIYCDGTYWCNDGDEYPKEWKFETDYEFIYCDEVPVVAWSYLPKPYMNEED